MKSRLFFSMLFVWVTFAGEEWTEVVYFQRKEAKMRIHIYDPPIVMEWFQTPPDTPEDLREKLKPIVVQPNFMHDSFVSWYASFLKHSTKSLIDIYGAKEELAKEFSEEYCTLEEAKNSYPIFRYRSILYSMDCLVDEEMYSMLVFTGGSNALTYFPEKMKDLKQTEWHGVSANLLKFEEERWKNHYSSPDPFKAMERFSDLDRLRAVMEAGYAYHSIKHMGIWPFAPSDVLKHDSVRDPYPGETLFRYPLKKPPIKKPAASDPAAKTPSVVYLPAFSEEQNSAPLSESCAVPWWTWLLGVPAVPPEAAASSTPAGMWIKAGPFSPLK